MLLSNYLVQGTSPGSHSGLSDRERLKVELRAVLLVLGNKQDAIARCGELRSCLFSQNCGNVNGASSSAA